MMVLPVGILVQPRQCSIQHIHRLHTTLVKSAKQAVVSKKYSQTICLPRSAFPARLDGAKRVALDAEIDRRCRFDEQYAWQRKHRRGKDFILHDGPPYANGSAHIGHAVNKILKDITIRYECSQGRRVHFVPGWDCHGLPIEMKAIKDGGGGGNRRRLTACETRDTAARFASDSIDVQLGQFSRWGLLTDWSAHYRTMSADYVTVQMRQFYALYQRGLIFRGYLPVHWSPSSRTALAESELEYNHQHTSTSVYMRFKLTSLSPALAELVERKTVFGLVWTTTPWSLVANKAICYNAKEEYTILKHEDTLYLVASKLVGDEHVQLALPGALTVAKLDGSRLQGCQYVHPMYPTEARPFLHGDHVTVTGGTGLVHTAPAHGQDDFRIGQTHGLQLDCLIDENGRFIESVGFNLNGLFIMDEGTEKVLDLLSCDILHQQPFVHSYPYDWRTKKPVFLRASKQWFIHTNQLKDKAIQAIEKVNIKPPSAMNGFLGVIKNRPYWCISRQRVWGSLIPVIYNKSTDEPVISETLIERYCQLMEKHGTGFWWSQDITDILGGTGLNPEEYKVGEDILDIWFDSGLSWAAVVGGQADMYLEGLDQFSGWFYTSLLTGVALTGEAPYKEIFVHGFTLDEKGNKMSKSLGNVVNPSDIVEGTKKKPAKGVDVLRWWVGLHASSSTSVLVGDNILKEAQMETFKIRNLIKFCLGMLNNFKETDVVSSDKLLLLDKIVLHKFHNFQAKVKDNYQAREYNKVCLSILSFISELSATHLHLIKDRLYCDEETGLGRRSGLSSIYLLLQGLLGVLSPITPHMAEEAADSVEIVKSPTEVGWFCEEEWCDQSLNTCIQILERLRDDVNKKYTKPKDVKLEIKIRDEDFQVLKHYPENELSEVLGVLQVQFTSSPSQECELIELSPRGVMCERCRKLTAVEGEDLCTRCRKVLRISQ